MLSKTRNAMPHQLMTCRTPTPYRRSRYSIGVVTFARCQRHAKIQEPATIANTVLQKTRIATRPS